VIRYFQERAAENSGGDKASGAGVLQPPAIGRWTHTIILTRRVLKSYTPIPRRKKNISQGTRAGGIFEFQTLIVPADGQEVAERVDVWTARRRPPLRSGFVDGGGG